MTRLDNLANACRDLAVNIGYAFQAVFDTLTDWIARPLRRLGLIHRPVGPLEQMWRDAIEDRRGPGSTT